MISFAGESQARNRYTFFASTARKEGLVQISKIFEETADNEKEHAKRFFSFLEGGMLEITAAFPAGVVGTTLDNLKAAAAGENEEWTTLYPEFARIARKEGFEQIAVLWEKVSNAENNTKALPRPLEKPFRRPRIQARRRRGLALHQLRIPPRRPRSPATLPRLPARPGLL